MDVFKAFLPWHELRPLLVRWHEGVVDPAQRVLVVAEAGRQCGKPGHVHLWDVPGRRRVWAGPTSYDIGGHRLAVSRDGARFASAAYDRFWLTMHSTADAAVVWQRTDIKKVQRLSFSPDGRQVSVHPEDGACRLLDAATGEEAARIRKCARIFWNPVLPLDLRYPRYGRVEVVGRDTGARVALLPPADRSRPDFVYVHECAFSPDGETAYLLEPIGRIRAISLRDGTEKWRYAPLLEADALVYSRGRNCLLAWMLPTEADPQAQVVSLCPETGEALDSAPLPVGRIRCILGADPDRLYASNGIVYELTRGEARPVFVLQGIDDREWLSANADGIIASSGETARVLFEEVVCGQPQGQ